MVIDLLRVLAGAWFDLYFADFLFQGEVFIYPVL